MSRTHIHPAFHTSLEQREMFGWQKQQPSHSLILDGCQRFTFQPSGDSVKWTRHARNGYKAGAWQVTGRDTLTLEQGRQQWKRLVKLGAVRV